MGFREWREDRKIRRELTPDEYATLQQADAQYRQNLARGAALAERDASEARRRAEAVQESSVDPYFKAVLCFSIAAGASLLRVFNTEARVAEAESASEVPSALKPSSMPMNRKIAGLGLSAARVGRTWVTSWP